MLKSRIKLFYQALSYYTVSQNIIKTFHKATFYNYAVEYGLLFIIYMKITLTYVSI